MNVTALACVCASRHHTDGQERGREEREKIEREEEGRERVYTDVTTSATFVLSVDSRAFRCRLLRRVYASECSQKQLSTLSCLSFPRARTHEVAM